MLNGNKLSLVTKLSEMFQRPLMSFSRPAGQQILRENLTSKWRGRGREAAVPRQRFRPVPRWEDTYDTRPEQGAPVVRSNKYT